VKPIAISAAASGHKSLLRPVYTEDQIFSLVQSPDTTKMFLHKP
jgi:hypothetical protein